MPKEPSSPTKLPTLAEFNGRWVHKSQALKLYDVEASELEAALLPCEIGPNRYRKGLYWKYNECDVEKLEGYLEAKVGLKLPAASQGTVPGFAKKNGKLVKLEEAKDTYNLTDMQMSRIDPVEGDFDSVYYNLCDVKALWKQARRIAPLLRKPSPTVTTDGEGTFYGRKTLAWVFDHGSHDERVNLCDNLATLQAAVSDDYHESSQEVD